MGWKAIARSATGTSHQEQKIPCQDCGHYRIFNDVIHDVIVGAVADGAGSAKYSHFGSELAVKTVIKCFADINELPDQQGFSQPLNQEEAKEVFTKFVKEVIRAFNEKADNKGYSVSDLACTLLVFIATPEWVAAMQIGDGFMVVRSQDAEYNLSLD